MNKLRTGDEVIVIAGKDKGKRGRIASRAGEAHVVVEGVNVVKKHIKPNPMKNEVGGIKEKTMPIHQSNVAIYNAATGKADRVGIEVAADGSRSRVFKSDGAAVPTSVPNRKGD